MNPSPETLALFVRFVRLNPRLAHDDLVFFRAWKAYVALEAEDARDILLEVGAHTQEPGGPDSDHRHEVKP